MNVEHRLIEVFQTSAATEPTADLYSRVVSSIEQDRLHRRRVLRTVAAVVGGLAAFVCVGLLSMQDSPGTLPGYVHRPTMEALEWAALAGLVLALGPGIRRFGRGYAHDLWPRSAATPGLLLRLLDLAYYLIGTGYILLSAEFQFTDSLASERIGEQLAGAAARVGGLLLTFGVMHATALLLLPLIALIDNSTRKAAAVPRWVLLLLVAVVLALAPVVQAAIVFALSG